MSLPLEPQAYLYILRTLGVGGYRDETLGRMGQLDYGPGHFTCFQFPYDWRRDNVEPIAWSSVTFLFSDHLALTKDLGFTDNLLFRLLDSPRPGTSGPAARSQP